MRARHRRAGRAVSIDPVRDEEPDKEVKSA